MVVLVVVQEPKRGMACKNRNEEAKKGSKQPPRKNSYTDGGSMEDAARASRRPHMACIVRIFMYEAPRKERDGGTV